MAQRKVKRIFDILLSFLLLVLLSPIFLFIALCIKLESKGEVFFKQERIGFKEKKFKIIKFRSMIKDAQYKGAGTLFEGENDPRITKVGKFLRKTSLDELPQIINILKGEMSFIGPRPALEETHNTFEQNEKLRVLMKPGISGLAQVNGRNELSWPKRVKYDLEYVNNFNLWLDIKILFQTIYVILTRKGIKMGQTTEELYGRKDHKT